MGDILLLTAGSRRGKRRSAADRRRGVPSSKQREAKVAKVEWGMKRLCPNCGTRYYDMRRDPIVCPHCGSPFDPEALLKTRRTRAPAVAEPVADEEIEPDLGAEEVPEPAEAE